MPLTAVILAGGHSRRMGRAKETLPYGKNTFLGHIAYALQGCVCEVAISAAAGQEICASLPIWRDEIPDRGPMGGLLTALVRARTDVVLLVACDLPDVSAEAARRLYAQMAKQDECVVPVVQGQVQPLFGCYRKALLPRVRQLLTEGRLAMRALLERSEVRYVPWETPLRNINTMCAYEQFVGEDKYEST